MDGDAIGDRSPVDECNPRWRYQKEGAIGLAADSAREQLSFTI